MVFGCLWGVWFEWEGIIWYNELKLPSSFMRLYHQSYIYICVCVRECHIRYSPSASGSSLIPVSKLQGLPWITHQDHHNGSLYLYVYHGLTTQPLRKLWDLERYIHRSPASSNDVVWPAKIGVIQATWKWVCLKIGLFSTPIITI